MAGDPDDVPAFHDPAPGPPEDLERVLLTAHEQRVIEAIERHIWRNDPSFAEQFERLHRRQRAGRWWRLFHPWR